MELKSILLIVLGASVLGGIGLYAVGQWLGRKGNPLWVDAGSTVGASPKQTLGGIRQWFTAFLLKSYAAWMKVPPLRYYAGKIRMRLALSYPQDELKLRRQTMKLAYGITGSFAGSIAILTAMHPDVLFVLSLLITAVVLQDLLIDGYVNRLEVKLLEQLLDFFAAVRHAFHRHGMVPDAIEEAGEATGREIGVHAHWISEALVDADPDTALEKYYEKAPSRYLKAFAGISRLVSEYGDRKRAEGSMYLRGISRLTGEVQLELIRRRRLDYLLKGLHVIALVPVFFTKPVEMWARGHFPLMDAFYLSKAGMLIKAVLFLTILLSYVLLQKLKNEEETAYRAKPTNLSWEARVYAHRILGRFCRQFVPSPESVAYHRISQLLKETNHRLRIEAFQVRRISILGLSFVLALGGFLVLHQLTKQRILTEPPAVSTFFGALPKDTVDAGRQEAARDAAVMRQLGMSAKASYDEVFRSVSKMLEDAEEGKAHEELSEATHRILDKLQRWNQEYLKWWEFGLALLAGLAGYYLPLWMLYFQRWMRLIDMRHEVYQFLAMIAILRELERISVEEILEWLASYAVIFREPLHKCLLNYSFSPEEALLELKREVVLEEFQRLADKLLLASEKLLVADAFDDLDSDLSYQFERRRLDYEKSLDIKANWGRMIGFTPMYALVFAYLVIPLIWMSFEQMNLYFEQLQKL
ncbi:hypothetical protein POTG_03479 [Paenibacillus sp. oral taxon 786 str. D14]|uniref:hypothetical protein n=1 Tax=Paenibacillus sp. oral taxon 786 TaxID=652715 RepID=UPI0001AFDBF6|nr:hypothetical protein [Paenibacillus sp. oral taxon 786]EES71962.1 hypothetical protein POTG_03479 [Paenibacillus sp. oral taxon 786 str. D14]